MAVSLRDYQQDLVDKIKFEWVQGNKHVCAVSPCRSGKTVTFTSLSVGDNAPSCAVVHRQELIGQISTTHARMGVPHNIIAPQPVINFCIQQQIKETGRTFYDPGAPATVAGVDTLIRRVTPDDPWAKRVQRWTIDECHHALMGTYNESDRLWVGGNKWGKAIKLFTNARGLGVTATPIRGDGKSLHIDQGGSFHSIVQGVGMRDLINGEHGGAICEYRVIAPQSSIDEAALVIGASGEFTDKSVKKATEKSKITGDAVETYLQNVNGKSAIAFCSDVDQAEKLAEKFRQAGVTAISLDGTTPDAQRQEAMDKFARGEIKVMTNCELFSEGLDLPGVDVCIMCRPTNSFGMFVQQFCRPLTPDAATGKQFGWIIDHVGNVLRLSAKYGMPDTPRRWALWQEAGKKKQAKEPDAIPQRSCEGCTLAFEATTMTCPYCGYVHLPADRGSPQQVAGILTEMSPELLEQLRNARAQVWEEVKSGYGAQHNAAYNWRAAQNELTGVMDMWGGVQLAAGYSDSQMQARFYHRFQVDVMSAQALRPKDANALTAEIRKALS